MAVRSWDEVNVARRHSRDDFANILAVLCSRLGPNSTSANVRRRAGRLAQAGWAIWYLFGSNENGKYLDYYASHRMTSDRHVRIYANGKCESLPAIQDFRRASEDPKEDARLEAEYYTENQRVAEMLEAKGFGLWGDEPGGVQMNRFLHPHKPEETTTMPNG